MTYTRQDMIQITPIPADAPALPAERPVKTDDGWQRYEISHYWAYHNSSGEILHYDVRYQTPDGKAVLPLSLWQAAGGPPKWKFKAPPGDRTLYNLHLLSERPRAQVLIVEGCKCAETAQAMLEEAGAGSAIVAITWQGGTQAINKTDWTPLKSRKIIIWPDFDVKYYPERHRHSGQLLPRDDQPGMKAALAIIEKICQQNNTIRIIEPPDPPEHADGWDIADMILNESATFEDVFNFIKQNARELPPPPEPDDPGPLEPPPFVPLDDDDQIKANMPFRCLGYAGEFRYFVPHETRQIYAVKADSMGQGSLRVLAPLEYWERQFGSEKGPNWNFASNYVLRHCAAQGVYDPHRIRGRGAWFDDGRIVIHSGDRLLVNGSDTRVEDIQSRNIYEASSPLEFLQADHLPVAESRKLLDICQQFFWEQPIYATYFAGWCVVAPICGALQHRPHIWLTGAASSGKTTAIDLILKPCLGEFALHVQSATTSAGVRQRLGSDALPVIFDEFESEDHGSALKIQSMLELARQAFSDTGAVILKGSQSGKAQSFLIRSSFMFSSIMVNLIAAADKSRIAVLSLDMPRDSEGMTKKEHFSKLQNAVHSTLTAEYCASLRARTINLIPIIRKNAETFTMALAEKIGSRRAGDQLGPLVAGAYSLVSNGIVTPDMAQEWVSQNDFEENKAIAEDSDERKCLTAIMSHIIRTGSDERSILELIYALKENHEKEAFGIEESDNPVVMEDQILRRHGVRFIHKTLTVYISSSHPGMRRILRETPFSSSFGRLLKRLPGSMPRSAMRFMGTPTRAIGIPWHIVYGKEVENDGV